MFERTIIRSRATWYSGLRAIHSITRASTPSVTYCSAVSICSRIVAGPGWDRFVDPAPVDDGRVRAGRLGDGDDPLFAEDPGDDPGHGRPAADPVDVDPPLQRVDSPPVRPPNSAAASARRATQTATPASTITGTGEFIDPA